MINSNPDGQNEQLKQERDDARRDLAIRANTVEYARQMLAKLPFGFGSDDFYESCDHVVDEVNRNVSENLRLRNYARDQEEGWRQATFEIERLKTLLQRISESEPFWRTEISAAIGPKPAHEPFDYFDSEAADNA